MKSDLNWAENSVVELSREYKHTWRDKPDDYWLACLMEEVGELAGALVGNHEGPVEWELKQIGAICTNWLDKRLHE